MTGRLTWLLLVAVAATAAACQSDADCPDAEDPRCEDSFVPVLTGADGLMVADFDDCLANGWNDNLDGQLGLVGNGNEPGPTGALVCRERLDATGINNECKMGGDALSPCAGGRVDVTCVSCDESAPNRDVLRGRGNSLELRFNVSGGSFGGRIVPLVGPLPQNTKLACGGGFNATAFDQLSFWVQAEPANVNMEVGLRDQLGCVTSPKRLILDVVGPSSAWRRVVIPLSDMQRGRINGNAALDACTVNVASLRQIDLMFDHERFKYEWESRGGPPEFFPTQGILRLDEIAFLYGPRGLRAPQAFDACAHPSAPGADAASDGARDLGQTLDTSDDHGVRDSSEMGGTDEVQDASESTDAGGDYGIGAEPDAATDGAVD